MEEGKADVICGWAMEAPARNGTQEFENPRTKQTGVFRTSSRNLLPPVKEDRGNRTNLKRIGDWSGPPQATAPKEVRVATINARRLRVEEKRTVPRAVQDELRIGACLVSQKHICAAVRSKRFTFPTSECPTGTVGRVGFGGEVPILAQKDVSAREVRGIRRPALPIHACAIFVAPSPEKKDHSRVTGTYFPPRRC